MYHAVMNRVVPVVYQIVMYTQTNLQLKAAGLFNQV